ncbi:MAG: M28 family peptidase, partial [Chitinophagaceae bacterium]|nr:M28 family peptidase [Chitinophagaceae bacterium]
MKRTLAGLVWLLIGSMASAQTNPEKYAATITSQSLKNQLTIIAGPAMEGRETATPGQRKAAEYIVSQFKLAGLQPAPGTTDYQQTFPLFYDTLINVILIVNHKPQTFGQNFIATLQANETVNIKNKKLVFAGYGINDSSYDDYAGKNVNGKFVVIFSGEPRVSDKYLVSGTSRPSKWGYFQGNTNKAKAAKLNGAAGIIVINPASATFPEMVGPLQKTNIYYPTPAATVTETVNQVTISHALAATILGSQFDSLLKNAEDLKPLNQVAVKIKNKVTFNFTELKVPLFSTNVAGFIEGTDKKDEYVILTGHYDHLGKRGDVIYFGADDDGSGTTSVIEMAKAFGKAKAEGNGPRRTIVFMTVSGEEKGLLGSQYYSENPLFPLDKTSVNLNTDMVGRIDPTRKNGDSTNYVYVIGEDKLSSDLTVITDEVNSKFVHLELDWKFNA